MAQLQATRPGPASIEGLDESLGGMLPTTAGLREWGSRLGVFAALGVGWLLANRLPALELAGGGSVSLDEVTDRLTAQSNGWVFSLVWFAGILTCVASVVFPPSERFAQVLAVTVGGLATMVGPYYVWSHTTDLDEQATGLGSGLVFAWVGSALAVAAVWGGVLWWNRADPVFGRDWSKWLFLLPAMVWILALTVFPLIFAITTSTYFYRSGKFSRTVGADNFRRLFIDGSIWGPIGRAIAWAAGIGVAVAALVLLASFLLNRRVSSDDVRRARGLLPIVAVPVLLYVLTQTILHDPLDNQLRITFFFVGVSVAIEMVLGFALALLLNREMRARGLIRAIVTIPIFATPIALGYLARIIFYEETGRGPVNTNLARIERPMNFLLGTLLGWVPVLPNSFNPNVPWLSNPSWARMATVIVDVWQWTPFVFIIALAGLQGLSQDIIEAAQLDGANKLQLLRYITVPLMAPILWLIVLLRSIDAFKVFDIPSGLTLGGPGRETEYYSLFNYRTARKFFDYGGASAQAFLLLFVVMTLVTLLWGRVKHVYEVEEGRA